MMYSRTRVKICGITRLEDALAAIQAGADAIGFVFVEQSARYITPEAAQAIIQKLPAFVQIVALVMNPNNAHINHIKAHTSIDLWQFHGDESADDISCLANGQRYIKALAARGRTVRDLEALMLSYPDASGFLIDGHGAGEMGGSGHQADWEALKPLFHGQEQMDLIIAGGINGDNVKTVIDALLPYAIDVSSGVETAPGVKSPDKIRQVCDTVRRLSCT